MVNRSTCGRYKMHLSRRSVLVFQPVLNLEAALPCCDNQGNSEYVGLISEQLETHATVYQPPGHSSNLPSFIRNHGLLTQEDFLRLMRRAKVR